MVSDTKSVEKVPTPFQLAFDRLYSTFSEKDKALYTSITLEEVLLKIHDLDQKHAASNISRSFTKRLQPVLYNLERYGRALDTLSQVQSMPLSLIWGSLRIIVEAGGSFIRYFDRLVFMIERLGDSFSLFSQYEELLGYDPRLEQALVNFYYHMLVLLSKAKRVFLTSGFKILCRCLWRSFETDFQAISEALARDTSVIGAEITLAWRKKVNSSLELHREESIQKSFSALEISLQKSQKFMEWLIPTDMSSVFFRERQRRVFDSGRWLSNHETFENWLSPSACRRLWIYGPPGCGKTVISTTIVESIERHFEKDDQQVTAFFYCNRNDDRSQSVLDVQSSIISQILDKFDDIPPKVFAVYAAAVKSGRSRITAADRPLLMLKDLAEVKKLHIVIDGLDESEEAAAIIKEFKELQESAKTVHVAFLSRELHTLKESLDDSSQVKITPTRMKSDIEEFLSRVIPEIFPENESLHAEIHSKLSQGSEGMFLWVNLMVQTLKVATSVFEIRRILDDLPRGLDVTYLSILQGYTKQSQERQELARRLLLWVCCSLRPLSWGELQRAIAIDGSDESEDLSDSRMPFKKAVLELCTPLIEYSTETDTFHPVHLSVCEYLFRHKEHQQDDEKIRKLFIDPKQGQLEIARSCISFLSRQDVAYEDGINVTGYPLVEYATMHWCTHLTGSRFCEEASQSAFEFLSCKTRRRIWITRFLFLDTAAFPLQHLLALKRKLLEWNKASNASTDLSEATDWIQDTTHILIDSSDGSIGAHETMVSISHFEKLMVIRDLSREYTMSGRLSDGERLLSEALQRQRDLNGHRHASTAWLLNGLAIIYDQQKRSLLAIETQEKALAIQEAEYGPNHLDTIWTVNELGRLYRHVSEYSKAEACHLRALEHLRCVLQPDDLQIAWTLNTLARTYRKQGRYSEAVAMHYEAIEIQKASLAHQHPHILWALSDVARCHRDSGDLPECVALHTEVLQGREETLGTSHADTLWSVNDLALAKVDSREIEEAKALYQRALEGQIEILGDEHEHTLWTKQQLDLMSNGTAS